jgi:hypothetical protein
VAQIKKSKLTFQAPKAPGIGTAWIGKAAIFAFGDGKLLIDSKAYYPHDGGILVMTSAANLGLIITCGDDGKVIATDLSGQSHTLFHDPKAWLDGLIYHAETQLIAFSAGRDVFLRSIDQTVALTTLKPARAPTSIAFSGDGLLVAIGHSAGVSLFKLSQQEAVWQEFPCSGGPLSVALDQKGDFLFAGLAEPALAGWRLSDGQGFRMGGYPGKPRQLIWSANSKALLTSGGPALLIWPMTSRDGLEWVGPMGQAAGVYRPRLGLLTAVATGGDFAVTGWSDGGVDLVNLLDASFRHIGGPRPPKDLDKDPRALTTSIVAVACREDAKQISWISETGAYGTGAAQ